MRYGLSLTSCVKHANNQLMALTSNQLTNLDPAMLDDMAQGLNSLAYIAARFGRSEEELREIAEYEPIKVELARRKAVLQESGYTRKYIQDKQLQVLEHQGFEFVSSPEASHTQRMEFMKYLRESVAPKNAPTVNINNISNVVYEIVRDAPSGEVTEVFEATAIHVPTDEPTLPELPTFLLDKQVTANSDLSESV